MRNASWKGALLAVVASAGMACGQSVDSTVIIRQKDGLPEPCRVVKKWTTAEGRPAFLLQSLDTDEMLTVVQQGAGKKGNDNVGVGIYRWGNEVEPPKGSPVPPPDDGIRQAGFTTEAPQRKLGDLPRLAPHVAPPEVACAAPAPVVAHPATCPAGGCDKGHCSVVHLYEKPTTVYFRPGECLPVCTPAHAPSFGYYQTQWHAFPRGGEPPADAEVK